MPKFGVFLKINLRVNRIFDIKVDRISKCVRYNGLCSF
jgi:hypothetical protein